MNTAKRNAQIHSVVEVVLESSLLNLHILYQRTGCYYSVIC